MTLDRLLRRFAAPLLLIGTLGSPAAAQEQPCVEVDLKTPPQEYKTRAYGGKQLLYAQWSGSEVKYVVLGTITRGELGKSDVTFRPITMDYNRRGTVEYQNSERGQIESLFDGRVAFSECK